MSAGAWFRPLTIAGSLIPRDHLRCVPVVACARVLQSGVLSRLVPAGMGYVAAMDPISDHPDGATLRVHVVPGASRTELKGRHGDAIKVRVAAPPEAGRANQAVTELIEGLCGGRASIMSGQTSRTKIVLVRGGDAAHLKRILER